LLSPDVEEAGEIVWPDVETVTTEYCFAIERPDQWGQMISDLIQEEPRNRLIVDEVRKRKDSRALILTDRIEHANILAARSATCRQFF
jgi:hypothetical protein